jgi:hypothetical protein
MPTYQPNIPTGTVDLNIDYLALQGNFQTLNTTYGIDHVPFANSTPAVNGFHGDIHFNPFSTVSTSVTPNNYSFANQYPVQGTVPPGAPPTVAGIGQLFSAQVNDDQNTDTGLYWLSGNGIKAALTRNFQPVAAGTGYTFLPGGLIFQWTTVTSKVTGSTAFTWPLEFTTLFSATLTSISTDVNDTRTAQFLNTPNGAGGNFYVTNHNNSFRANPVFFMGIGV